MCIFGNNGCGGCRNGCDRWNTRCGGCNNGCDGSGNNSCSGNQFLPEWVSEMASASGYRGDGRRHEK